MESVYNTHHLDQTMESVYNTHRKFEGRFQGKKCALYMGKYGNQPDLSKSTRKFKNLFSLILKILGSYMQVFTVFSFWGSLYLFL